jgi:hypothetical protein
MSSEAETVAQEEQLLEINVKWRDVSAKLLKITSAFLDVVAKYVSLTHLCT